MFNLMNRIEQYFLQRAIHKAVLQGNHKKKIIVLYSLLVKEFREHFTEDNLPTQDAFLTGCHFTALNSVKIKDTNNCWLPLLPAKHCQNGRADICLAGARDGICCAEYTCDIDNGDR